MDYFLIGERHGTNECPHAFLELVKQFKPASIALEIPKQYQADIDAGKHAHIPFFNQQEHDGRGSAAMQQLITALLDRELHIHCVDTDTAETAAERDAEMARNILALPIPVMYLCGNVHALLKPITLFGEHLIPCGSHLPRERTKNCTIETLNGGTFYNFQVQHIPPSEYTGMPNELLPLNDEHFDYAYFVEWFTPSQ